MYTHRMEVLFWRHRSKKAGFANLYVRITVKSEFVEWTTGIKIRWDDWDVDTKRVRPKDPKSQFKNEQLLMIESRLMAIYNELFRRDPATISAGKIKRKYQQGFEGVKLVTAFEMYLKEVKTSPDLTTSTWEVYDNVRKKLIDFLIAQKALDVFVEDFDLDYLNRFRAWMKTVVLDAGKIGHEDSYIRKQSQTIKQAIRWAKTKKLADINPLDGVRIPGAKDKDPVYLTNEEFELMKTHRFSAPHVQEVADVFIIYCRTGFHYADLKELSKGYITALQKGVDGKVWIIKDRIKTEVTAKVPQFEEVKAIVDKYGGWEKLPIKSNKQMNMLLKVVGAELKLKKVLSTKIGRKTFTDWCYNTLGLSTEAILVLLGRKSSKGLEVYGRPDERRVAAELLKAKDRL